MGALVHGRGPVEAGNVVVVGDYFSLRTEHEKADMHFLRALRLTATTPPPALASAYESLASHSAPPPAPYGYRAPTTPIPAALNDRLLAAIRCCKHALRGSEDVPFALVRLPRLYGALGDCSVQSFYYGLMHRPRARLGMGGPSPEEFVVWLARDARGVELGEAEAFVEEQARPI
ncbi:hypothetical protein DFJ74DRAFT_702848 [Hyaloraphidium curvatum]|nr:hypothetical protein DFJ74DRAFT_702848 [Hyaloraphidium curvatum]